MAIETWEHVKWGLSGKHLYVGGNFQQVMFVYQMYDHMASTKQPAFVFSLTLQSLAVARLHVTQHP
jgi:hypothetical protein